MACKCSVKQKKYWLWGCSTFWLLFALVLGLLWPTVSIALLNQQLELREGSTTYENWIETPIPMYAEFYLFNWTNADQIRDANVRPQLVEMGPYVFEERHKRVAVEFFENSTVAFNQTRTWHFVPERSNGTLEDEVTHLNTIAMTALKADYGIYLETMITVVIHVQIRYSVFQYILDSCPKRTKAY